MVHIFVSIHLQDSDDRPVSGAHWDDLHDGTGLEEIIIES